LDGDQVVEIVAQSSGLDPATIDLIVADHESLSATSSAPAIDENAPGSVSLTLRRSNTDTSGPLSVSVAGGDSSQLDLPVTLIIPAGKQSVEVPLQPIDGILGDNDDQMVAATLLAVGNSSRES
jgi:hypothetical protein